MLAGHALVERRTAVEAWVGASARAVVVAIGLAAAFPAARARGRWPWSA